MRRKQAAMRADQAQPLSQKEYDFVRDFDEVRRDLLVQLAVLAERESEISGQAQ